MTLGDTILEKRKERNLTQTEVAESLFVSRQTIANWERDKTLPDIESLIRLAEFYQLSLDEIFLNDSAVVESIKRQEQLVQEYRWLGIPCGIFILTSLLVYHAALKQDIFSLLGLSGVLILLLGQVVFLKFQLNKVQRVSVPLLSKKLLIVLAVLFVLGGFAGFVFGIFD